ncbi:MAG: hypothetical protein JWO89_2420 [Verrucomicrobiaceae bacterium]|nr:hypothetical protein [Verrucomicrobiaceae bacterium]MDB6116456.1 hypothetical protein [Verrucomicrobiaceae bacterium]
MKNTFLSLTFAALSLAAASAQSSTTTTTKTVEADGSSKTSSTTTTSSGTITEYTPGSTFIVKETTGPVTYRYGNTVSYVTSGGKVLTDDDVKLRIKVGAPVHVHYMKDGDARVISRVVIDE